MVYKAGDRVRDRNATDVRGIVASGPSLITFRGKDETVELECYTVLLPDGTYEHITTDDCVGDC